MTSVKDALNNVLESHSYDNQGRAITSERAGGVNKQTISYGHTSGSTLQTRVTDALGRVTRYNYKEATLSGLKQLVSVEGNCDCGSGAEKTSYQYDSNWNVVKETDALGNSITYTYDADGNVLTVTNVLGTQTYTYNSFGQVLTATDRMGGVTTNTYDAKGNLLTTKDALNNTTTMTYTTKGQLASVKDARNNTATMTYDALGRLTRVTDADNKATTYAYDARSRVTSITNALNEKVSYTYDANDRLKRITYPDTNYQEFTYDLAGRRTRVRDEKGNNTSFTYDTSYRLTKVTDALNNTVSYSYDLMSNMTSMTDGVGKVTNYQYDDFDRLTKVIYPAATTGATRLEERYEYDAVGNVKKHIDTANRETLYRYDTAHRLTSEKNALNQNTYFSYNRRSDLTRVMDAKGQQYFFTYDALGRRLTKSRGEWKASYIYDAVGNLTKRTDYANRVTNYTYDKLNRLTQISYVGQTAANVRYTYDALGRMLTAVNSAGTVTLTYDNRGRLTSENDVHNQTVGYGYEANGNRSSLSLNGTNHTTYAYDVVNRLTSLTSAADNAQFRYSYDKADRLTSKVLPNGITTTYEYDGMSRLTRLKDATTVKTHYDRRFTYNTANQISKITEPTKTRNFAYDAIDRLTKMTSPTTGVSAEKYWYDKLGNRTASHKSVGYKTENFNKLEATANASYTYDANGNMTSKTVGGVTWVYSWDYENRLTEANNGTVKVRYEYDGLGRRVKRTKGAGSAVAKPTTPTPNYQLTPSATSVAPGATMSISWSVTSGDGQLSGGAGWISLYKAGGGSASGFGKRTGSRTTGTYSWKMPRVAGDYEFKYFSQGGSRGEKTSAAVKVVATKFDVIVEKTLVAPGESIDVSWQAPVGQTNSQDRVGLYKVGDADTAVAQWRQNTGGGALGNMSVKLPTTAGDYEFRYFSGTGNTKKATSQKITVVDPTSYQLTVSATSVGAEATIRVSWSVPAGQTKKWDRIGLSRVGGSDSISWVRGTRTRGAATGSFSVKMPKFGGDYEFRYLFQEEYASFLKAVKVATSATVKVEATSFELTGGGGLILPGESVNVWWSVPARQTSTTDWIGLYKVGDADTAVAQWRQNTGGNQGNATVKLPSVAGDYEFRYFSGTGNTKKATSRKITVVDPTSYQLTVSATSVGAEATIRVSWSVPAGQTKKWDRIGLSRVGGSDSISWVRGTRTRGAATGSFSVKMPKFGGDYEFRYLFQEEYASFLKAVKVATSATVKVEATSFELVGGGGLILPGESVGVSWSVPARQTSATDWIGLYKVGDADTAVAQWRQNTGGGDMGNMSVKLPTTAGDYEFRYFSGTGNMKKATSQKVTVVDPSSYKLEVSGTSVTSGSRIGMLWQLPVGQASEQDWVGLYKVGDADTAPQWKQNTQGKVMGSFSVQMPSTVGDYEFRYFFDKGYRKVATSAKTSAKVTVRASTGSGTSGSAGGKSSGRIRTEVIRYTYDGWDVIRENSSLKGITTYQNGLGIDDKLRSKNGTTVRYFLTDHLGSTVALTDSSGKIVSSTSYDSFGNATSNIATSYRYTGREYDADTGLYYYRNRWYDPEIGRFISKDPIGFAGGDINLYGYVGNNPLSFTDPSGNYACDNQKRQKGGYPGARLGDCLKLNVPGFMALPKVAWKLLKNTFGKLGALIIYEWNFSNYEKAVFVNTVVAAAYVGADFSNAKFGGFYSADGTPNGIYVTGLKGIKRGRHEIGGSGILFWRKVGASVEYEDDHIDVDLYHSKSFMGGLGHFFLEWIPNKLRGKGTRPWDVAKKLKEKANIDTGVSCKEII